MPIPELRTRVVAVFGCALIAMTLVAAAQAAAKTTPGDLRVVNPAGRTLADQTQYTTTTKIKTDKKADCFGEGSGGSGDSVKVTGATALGLIADGAVAEPKLSPLSVTDSFDFGLGLCGIGKTVAPETGFWYLKVNHEASQSGGDQTKVKSGDEILWFLIEDFNDPVPDELALKVPALVKPGDDIPVQVTAYGDDGKKVSAKGVQVTGAKGVTDASGETTVPADADLLELQASRDGAIPSAQETVCATALSDCDPGYATTIGGTDLADKITAGKLAETIIAGGGDDVIDARKGSAPDAINCGSGDDTLKISSAAEKVSKLKGCEKVA
jgi:hypothetical protein